MSRKCQTSHHQTVDVAKSFASQLCLATIWDNLGGCRYAVEATDERTNEQTASLHKAALGRGL